jgi:AhpD family alkylhydroperoxidase
MRLLGIDRGDSVKNHRLIRFISTVSRMRLPDPARVAFYHKNFFSPPLGARTQAAMRGPSQWRTGERELMAVMVAKWNSCAFCVSAHSADAAKTMERPLARSRSCLSRFPLGVSIGRERASQLSLLLPCYRM